MKRKHLWKQLLIASAGMLLSASFASLGAVGEAPPDNLRSVTYVSDQWVINFWNSESDHMDEELAQIAADGFNSIVLAVPWREFQPSSGPDGYCRYAFDKLDRVMQSAREHELWVILRVGYTWDYSGDEPSLSRFKQLPGDDDARRMWMDYVETLYQAVSGYDNFYGGFITWEEFWNYIEDAPEQYGAGREGVAEAKRIGFQAYLRENYTLEEVNTYFTEQSVSSFDQISIPKRNSPAYKLFYEYYDQFLIDLLKDTQQVFPNLSMEVRLDVDPVTGLDGENVGAAHYQTFPCGESDYTALMYSVSMGQSPNRLLTAQEAISMMEHLLGLVKACNEGKPIYIDQLLYMDMTPGFEHNARLLEDERNAFLTGIPDILEKYTNGYAVWTYRNYANNGLFNSQFALGSTGWNTRGATIVQRGGSSQARLQKGGSISQDAGSQISRKQEFENHVRFTADSDKPVGISVILGGVTKQLTINGKEQIDLNFGYLEYDQVEFRADGDVYLDNICVYNFVQEGELYDLDGNELSCLEGIRQLNQKMEDRG